MKLTKRWLGYLVALCVNLLMALIYRVWKLPLWTKATVLVVVVSLVAMWLNKSNVFSIDRGTLIGVLTLQTGFAAYLVSVSRSEHVERLIPVVQRIFNIISKDDELKGLVEGTSFITLQLPQRLAIYVLVIDVAMCPFMLFEWHYIQLWIVLMTFVCMFWLVFGVLLLRVELFEKWLSSRVAKLYEFLKQHGQDVLILLLFLGLAFAASNWLKKQGKSNENIATPEPPSEPQHPISIT